LALNLRSWWQHKAWGASPRIQLEQKYEPAKRATAHTLSPASRARSPFVASTWGLRPRLYASACFAGSRRKCCHLLRRFSKPPTETKITKFSFVNGRKPVY